MKLLSFQQLEFEDCVGVGAQQLQTVRDSRSFCAFQLDWLTDGEEIEEEKIGMRGWKLGVTNEIVKLRGQNEISFFYLQARCLRKKETGKESCSAVAAEIFLYIYIYAHAQFCLSLSLWKWLGSPPNSFCVSLNLRPCFCSLRAIAIKNLLGCWIKLGSDAKSHLHFDYSLDCQKDQI